MDNNFNQKRSRQIRVAIILGFVFIIIIAGFVAFTALQHRGKVAVNVVVIPNDSTLSVNGQSTKAGKLYLKPGTYTLTASRPYFDNKTRTINTSDINKGQIIYVLPIPSSADAVNYLNSHPAVQTQRELAGGTQDQQTADNISAKYPIIKQLPHTDIGGPYTINYSIINNVVSLQVTNSAMEGRLNAIKWIKSQGDDPSNYTIDFLDATNPFAGDQP